MNRCYLALFLSLVLLFSCGGPPVRQTVVGDRASELSNWTIVWTGEDTSSEKEIEVAGLTDKSKYTLPEYCNAYVQDIRDRLASDHGVPLYNNMPVEGRIEVTLHGVKRHLTGRYPTDAELLREELTEERTVVPGAGSVSTEQPFYFGEEDVVKKAEVALYDFEGALLGTIIVGARTDATVKPKHVAEAIAKAIAR